VSNLVVPEEHKSVVEEAKLINSWSEEATEVAVRSSGGGGGWGWVAGILRGGSGGGKRKLWKLDWDLSKMSWMSADSEIERWFVRRKWRTDSMSDGSIEKVKCDEEVANGD